MQKLICEDVASLKIEYEMKASEKPMISSAHTLEFRAPCKVTGDTSACKLAKNASASPAAISSVDFPTSPSDSCNLSVWAAKSDS